MRPDFVHETRPGRVVFAVGARARLRDEAERLGLRRLLVVCTPGQAGLAAEVAAPLEDLVAELHPYAAMHVPAAVATEAVARARLLDADGCVAVGGGSAIGLAKIIARDAGLPVIAVPTTYAGSEMTPVWGLTTAGHKTTGRDPRVLPATVLYDPELTLTLPVGVTVTSGMNALAHAAEALYAPDVSPITALVAAESAAAITAALPRLAAAPQDLEARCRALYGAWLAGTALGSTTMSLHHQLCHLLGGAFDLPHAETHAVVLPHVLAHNLPAAPEASAALQAALGTADPARAVFELARELGAPTSLGALGMPADGIRSVVDQAISAPYANPAPVTEAGLHRLLRDAHQGTPPQHGDGR